jgi:phosphoribosylformimino-5-aminoimidazole carboxamide ribotide isomerase
LKVIPVIDILNGAAVHAVRGRRSQYQPLKSVLCDSADPVAVAAAFKACNFKELYIADLDAIMENGENYRILQQIVEKTGLRLLVDAGSSDLKQAQRLLKHKVAKVVIGTETLLSLDFVKAAVECFGSGKVIVSLDLKAGKVLSCSESLRSMLPVEDARQLQSLGVEELIVLDLARVGSGEGFDLILLKELLDNLTLKVLVGGGVNSLKDLATLRDMGVYGVLLATALHTGKITAENLQNAGLI